MVLETKRLVLREMNKDDYEALYAVLADSDIMQHYPYTFDEKRVKDHLINNGYRCDQKSFGNLLGISYYLG